MLAQSLLCVAFNVAMSVYYPDTIAAAATASGRGGIGIVRLSGRDALTIALKILQHPLHNPTPKLHSRIAYFLKFYDSDETVIDEGIVLLFKNPHSFTGEDVVEFQGHGGPMVIERMLRCLLHHGARLANPGEFSQRAFLNKKMDLTQVEAIADLINATTDQAARSAVRSLQGEFSKKIQTLQQSLTNLRIQIEAMIDFPEEEIDFLSDPRVHALVQKTIDDVAHVKKQAKTGALLQQGLQVVIAGKPNAGKSSLLNYLSGRDSAIVTPIPGTTRDILRESIHIDGMPLHVIDTAGLRETDDIVEQEGMKRAYAQIEQADLIIYLIDSSETESKAITQVVFDFQNTLTKKIPMIVVSNKIDLTHEKPAVISHDDFIDIKLSLIENIGTSLLMDVLKKHAGYQPTETDGFIARRRHVDAIERAHTYLLQGQQQLLNYHAGELLAEELRNAQLALSEITGEFTSDDLLGDIFSSFCIGK